LNRIHSCRKIAITLLPLKMPVFSCPPNTFNEIFISYVNWLVYLSNAPCYDNFTKEAVLKFFFIHSFFEFIKCLITFVPIKNFLHVVGVQNGFFGCCYFVFSLVELTSLELPRIIISQLSGTKSFSLNLKKFIIIQIVFLLINNSYFPEFLMIVLTEAGYFTLHPLPTIMYCHSANQGS
jgi:hypothetical protein